MGADDEMAVVLYKKKWYVSYIQGGNWQEAVLSDSFFEFDKLGEAMVSVHESNTEHGIRVYKNHYDYEINEYLEQYYKNVVNKFCNIQNELKETNARKHYLTQLLSVHGVYPRNDSKLFAAYVAGGLEEVQKINPDIKTVDDIVFCLVELSFLFTHTTYPQLLNKPHDRNDLTKIKTLALKNYAKRISSMRYVPIILMPKLQQLREEA